MRADFALLLLGALKSPRHGFLNDTLSFLRAQKDGAEFDLLKGAARIDDAAMTAAFAFLEPGMTELEVDAFIRSHTIERFGPVCSVTPELVFELGFEGIQPSPRHKSGIAVRFPRMLRRRLDKRAAEADTIDALRAMIGSATAAQGVKPG